MNRIKKIVAIITTFTFLFTLTGPAMAVTVEELQAQIADLLALISSLSSQLATLQGGTGATITGCTITSFDRNLKMGMSGDDAKCLQIVLNTDSATQVASSGVGSPGNETSYFGSLTNAAVIKFQEKYASEVLATYGLTTGTGFVGTTTRAKLNSLLSAGAGTGTGTGETGTAATISLSADTPIAAQTARNAQDVIFTKVKFTAGASAYTVSSIVVKRGGVAADTDVSAIKLYDGSTQLGSTQALNTTTHKASFSGLNWTIPAYSVKYLTIKGSIAAVGTAQVGNSVKLGIYVATDITSTATPSGTFPIWSNAMTIAGISVGELFVAKRTSPATTTLLSGSIDQEIACWNFNATNTEGFSVRSIKVSQVGTASREDLSNLKLKVSGVQIGSTISQFDSTNGATFDLSSSPLSIIAGATKAVCAFADIDSGIWTGRTAIFEITQYTDVVAYGANSGGAVTISVDDNTTYTKQTGNTMTVGQGALIVAIDASQNPSSQTYVKGTTNRLITSLKFSTGSIEGARITSLRLTLGGTLPAATDISNVSLWDGTTQIATASVIGSYATFGPGIDSHSYDTSGLFDLEVSTVKTILVKADIPTGANTAHTVSLSVAASSVWADGLNSQYDLPSASITGTATGNAHSISTSGNLAVSVSSQTPPAQDYVIGATGKEFVRINLTADSGEDIDVTSIILDMFSNRKAATTGAHFTNVKLVKEDGTQFGTTVANPIATASFSGSLTIPASETVVLKAIGDIPSSSYPIPNGSMSVASTTAIASALTSTGRASSADIVETGSAIGNTMTIGRGSLVVTAASSPSDQTIIIGASEVPLVGLVFTAGTEENIRVTSITLTQSSSGEGSTTDVTYLALYDGATRLTAKESLTAVAVNANYVTFSGGDWLNTEGLNITKGQQKTITVKADIPATAVTAHKFAIGVSTTAHVVFTGLSSNTTPTPTATQVNYHYTKASVAAHYESVLTSAGILTIDTTADTPVEGIQSVGTVGLANVVFLKTYFAATMEKIYIKSITIESKGHPTSTNPATFASVSLWDGTTQLGIAQAIDTNASTTFNFVPGSYWEIPTVGAKYLTIKANLNGVRTAYSGGSVTGDNVYLCIDTVTAEGVSSGATPAAINSGTSGIIDECDNSYRQTIRQSKPTIALASPTAETYGGGTKELIRWTVSADALGNISWRKMIFDVTGGIILTSGGASYTVGCPATNDACKAEVDGVYMGTSTDEIATALIATSSMQIWDVGANTRINATGSDVHGWTVDQSTSAGTARISFVANGDQIVAAGTSKTYKLIGDIQQGSGQPGSSLSIKIAARSTATTTQDYATVAGTTANFVWSDRSGGSYGTHSLTSGDWTNEYKVIGLPTSTKTLSK